MSPEILNLLNYQEIVNQAEIVLWQPVLSLKLNTLTS